MIVDFHIFHELWPVWLFAFTIKNKLNYGGLNTPTDQRTCNVFSTHVHKMYPKHGHIVVHIPCSIQPLSPLTLTARLCFDTKHTQTRAQFGWGRLAMCLLFNNTLFLCSGGAQTQSSCKIARKSTCCTICTRLILKGAEL